jgi:Na+-driven multidrug efflux pump
VVITLLAGAVSSAVTPHFSRMIAHRDWAGCRHTLRTWVRLTALVSTPIALALIAGSHWLIRAHLPARRLRAARHSAGHAGAGHVRHSDSVFCLQPGFLSLSGCHAPQ